MYPALVKVGFSDKFSLGLVTSSGSLGLLLAPSLPLILYGIVAQQSGLGEPFSIQDLFIAGLLPAALMVVLLSLWAVWQQRDQWHQRQRFTAAITAKIGMPLSARKMSATVMAMVRSMLGPLVEGAGSHNGVVQEAERHHGKPHGQDALEPPGRQVQKRGHTIHALIAHE